MPCLRNDHEPSDRAIEPLSDTALPPAFAPDFWRRLPAVALAKVGGPQAAPETDELRRKPGMSKIAPG